MSKPITCSSCHMMLQFPPNATAIRCTNCQSVVRIPTQNNGLSAPPTNGYNNNYKLPLSQQPAGSLPLAQGNKKALIIGISYKNSDNELKGCINDAKLMSYLLINKFKYPESSIRMLTDEGTDPNRIPTKRNIQSALLWLVQDCKAGDSLVFHYSGHGKRMRNHTLDEKDGYDEAIVPLDYEKQGVIVDDEINATIVRPLPQGVTLHAIMDCCNSGTVLDLPYLCQIRYKQYQWEDHRPRSGIWQGTGGGIAISISGCDDDQISQETMALDKVNKSGALTVAFVQVIEGAQHALTYGTLLTRMKSTIYGMDNDKGGLRSKLYKLVTGMRRGALLQKPQLCANEPFDVYKKTFSL